MATRTIQEVKEDIGKAFDDGIRDLTFYAYTKGQYEALKEILEHNEDYCLDRAELLGYIGRQMEKYRNRIQIED